MIRNFIYALAPSKISLGGSAGIDIFYREVKIISEIDIFIIGENEAPKNVFGPKR